MYRKLEISAQQQDGEEQDPFHRDEENKQCKKFFIPRTVKHDGIHDGIEKELEQEIANHDKENHPQRQVFFREDERGASRRNCVEVIQH